ncbi:MAG: glycyl-radical enzyme activating protein [Desulfomonilia bacterium]|nr:glycyl-radical enzyme activating protein [Desulfomonilia bacterium]
MKGLILRIQRMSTEDGPGIRSTVFLKGCPLSCIWCHNPESISPRAQVHWVETRCIGCLSCLDTCPEKALTGRDKGISIDRERCTGCLVCTQTCPSTALEAYGTPSEVEDLVSELIKDRIYFEKSGGGVTLSGGEPTMQPNFSLGILKSLKEKGIHTALDTCGQCSWEILEELLPYTNLVLYDLKLMDKTLHRGYTGVSNKRILENLTRLGHFLREHPHGKSLWIRTPIIPRYTAYPENIRAIGTFLRGMPDDIVDRWELCAFNNLCTSKYDGLNIDWRCRELDLISQDEMQHLAAVARYVITHAGIVHVSGATRKEKGTAKPDRPRLSVIPGGSRS